MNIIVIDDEKAPLLTFAGHLLDNASVTANLFTTQVEEALEFAATHDVAAVFLDIVMPKISGIDLAEKFIAICPDIKIVFITGYAQNIEEIRARIGENLYDFCYKPYDAVRLNSILAGIVNEAGSTVTFRTFSHFDCFIGDRPVDFTRAKSKELLALLVDRRGGTVTMEEAIACLWPEKQVELAKKLYRDAVCRLRLTLQKYHIAHLIDVRRARLALKTRYCACDLWDFLDGREGVKFTGEYLRPYEWSTERENGLCALAASLPTESALSPTDAP